LTSRAAIGLLIMPMPSMSTVTTSPGPGTASGEPHAGGRSGDDDVTGQQGEGTAAAGDDPGGGEDQVCGRGVLGDLVVDPGDQASPASAAMRVR